MICYNSLVARKSARARRTEHRAAVSTATKSFTPPGLSSYGLTHVRLDSLEINLVLVHKVPDKRANNDRCAQVCVVRHGHEHELQSVHFWWGTGTHKVGQRNGDGVHPRADEAGLGRQAGSVVST